MNTPAIIRQTRSISYWQHSVGLPSPNVEQLKGGELETELCIVGGGVAGSSAAYYAAQQGLDVVVVEAREPALGASGRNAGMVLSGIADNYAEAVRRYGRDTARELWQLSIDNREEMLSLADKFGVPFDRCGSWLLADNEEEAAMLVKTDRLLSEDGFADSYSSGDPTGRGFVAGLYRPNDAVINPAQFVQALIRAAGVSIVAGSPVTRLEEGKGGRTLVGGEGFTVLAKHVLLNTNAYAPLLHPYFIGKVIPCRGQIQVSAPAPMVFRQAGYSHFGYWYFRQIPLVDDPSLGRWLIGGGRHLHFASENNTYDDTISEAVQADLQRYTAQYFPELAAVPISHRWAGTMGFTVDGLPIVGALADQPTVVFCVGFNGHGMGLGVMVVKRALALLNSGADPGIFNAARLDD